MAGKKLECFTTKEKRVVCKDAKSKEGQQIKAHKKSKKSEVLAKGAVRRVGSKSKIFMYQSQDLNIGRIILGAITTGERPMINHYLSRLDTLYLFYT
mgnify:CR=1 FL=1